jgi:hypothetical protein
MKAVKLLEYGWQLVGADPLDDNPSQVLTRRSIPLWETGRMTLT